MRGNAHPPIKAFQRPLVHFGGSLVQACVFGMRRILQTADGCRRRGLGLGSASQCIMLPCYPPLPSSSSSSWRKQSVRRFWHDAPPTPLTERLLHQRTLYKDLIRSSKQANDAKAATLAEFAEAGLRANTLREDEQASLLNVFEQSAVLLNARGVSWFVMAIRTMGIPWQSLPSTARAYIWESMGKHLDQFQRADAARTVISLAAMGVDAEQDENHQRIVSQLMVQGLGMESYEVAGCSLDQIRFELCHQQTIAADVLSAILLTLGERKVNWNVLGDATQQALVHHLGCFRPESAEQFCAVLGGLSKTSAPRKMLQVDLMEDAVIRWQHAVVDKALCVLGDMDVSWDALQVSTLRALVPAFETIPAIRMETLVMCMHSLAKLSFDCDYTNYASNPQGMAAEERERMELLWRMHRTAITRLQALLDTSESSMDAQLIPYFKLLEAVPGGVDLVAEFLGDELSFILAADQQYEHAGISSQIASATLAELNAKAPGRFTLRSSPLIPGLPVSISFKLDGRLFALVLFHEMPIARSTIFTHMMHVWHYSNKLLYFRPLPAPDSCAPCSASLAARIMTDAAQVLLKAPEERNEEEEDDEN